MRRLTHGSTLSIPCPGMAQIQGGVHDISSLHLAVCRSYDLTRERVWTNRILLAFLCVFPKS